MAGVTASAGRRRPTDLRPGRAASGVLSTYDHGQPSSPGGPLAVAVPVYALAMPTFDFALLRVDRDEDPTVVEGFFRTVEWPAIPREDESVEIADNLEPQTVESVGYNLDGFATVVVGRAVLDDLQAVQLRKAGWRVSRLRDGRP